jgi:hypothetical protein
MASEPGGHMPDAHPAMGHTQTGRDDRARHPKLSRVPTYQLDRGPSENDGRFKLAISTLRSRTGCLAKLMLHSPADFT